MEDKIIDGKGLADCILDKLPEAHGEELAIITVGDDDASTVYVRNKIKACERVGLKGVNYRFKPQIYKGIEDLAWDIKDTIKDLNESDNVAGIMIQQPYPQELKEYHLEDLIIPKKDVDGLSLRNLGITCMGDVPEHYPATPYGIMIMLAYYNIDVSGKNVAMIGRSKIVGKPMAAMLTAKNATVDLCHSKTDDLNWHTRRADIIISAVGKPKFIDHSYLTYYMPNYKKPVIIDVGMNRDENGKLCGDVDFTDIFPYVDKITPVPKGVGPMTVCGLILNVYKNLGFTVDLTDSVQLHKFLNN